MSTNKTIINECELRQRKEVLFHTNQSKIHQIYHDINNSLFVISGYITFGEYEKAKEKLNEICKAIVSVGLVITGNRIIDAMIQSKMDRARASNIFFSHQNKGIDLSFIDEMDICIAIGNALDNALEACLKVERKKERYLKIIFSTEQDLFTIRIINSINQPVMINGDTIKTTKQNKIQHGFGLKSIKDIVEKYNGTLTLNQNSTLFSIKMQFDSK